MSNSPSFQEFLPDPSAHRKPPYAMSRLPLFRLLIFTLKLTLLSLCLCFYASSSFSILAIHPAHAQLQIIPTPLFDETPPIAFSDMATVVPERKKSISLATTQTVDGIINQMEVQAQNQTQGSYWVAFSLVNPSDKTIERLIIAPHFSLINSGLSNPKLDESQILQVSVSEGIRPERINNPTSDIFRLVLNPRASVTVIAEIANTDISHMRLMSRTDYDAERFSFTFYQGIIVGVAAIIALFLTVIATVRGTIIFPVAACYSWLVLLYLLIDFGYLSGIFSLTPAQTASSRVATEAGLNGALLCYLFAFLNLSRWYPQASHVLMIIMALAFGTAGVAFANPDISFILARSLFLVTGAIGLVLITILTLRGFDRAVVLLPGWLLYCVWIGGAGALITGYITSPIGPMALEGGLVLVSLLFGFSVLQQAFTRTSTTLGIFNDQERRALALSGSCGIIWDWDVKRDRLYTNPELETDLGLRPGALHASLTQWLSHVYSQDRAPLQATIESVVTRKQGCISADFRFVDYSHDLRWYRLSARPLVDSDGVCLRCIGTLRDVGEEYRLNNRLYINAMFDTLTDLPNTTLLLDRCTQLFDRVAQNKDNTMYVVCIDFGPNNTQTVLNRKTIDNLIVPLSSRLKRLTQRGETLARIGDMRFALLGLDRVDPMAIAQKAKAMMASARTPIEIGDSFFQLRSSGGIAIYDLNTASAQTFLDNAIVALEHAYQLGGDRVESYTSHLRRLIPGKDPAQTRLSTAIAKLDVELCTRPVVRLATDKTVAYELRPQWRLSARDPNSVIDFLNLKKHDLDEDLLRDTAINVIHSAFGSTRTLVNRAKSPPIHLALPCDLLQRDDIFREIRQIASSSSVDTTACTLFFEETALARQPEQMIKLMNSYAALGLGIGLRNFGQGIGYLEVFNRCPVAYVYHQPLQSLLHCNEDHYLHGLIALCETLHVNLVVSQLDNKELIKAALDLTIQLGQGNAFAQGHLNQKNSRLKDMAMAISSR